MIINLNQYRKKRRRTEAETQAKENRVRFGRSKEARTAELRERERAKKEIENKRLLAFWLTEEAVLRARQAETFPQGPAFVFAAEEVAALEFGDDAVDEIVEAARDPRAHDVEAVAGVAVEPLLHLVGDHLGVPTRARPP
jgi:Domain of unknown function (DUF4169)